MRATSREINCRLCTDEQQTRNMEVKNELS